MKKSLRQMLLVGLSTTLLASVATPLVNAQDESTEESTEQVESVEETEATESSEEMTEELEDAEDATSEAQSGVDEALTIYEDEYPESVIEEIDVDLELNEEEVPTYTIFVRGFDVDNNDYELELQWVEGEVREQQFNEGWLNTTDDAEETAVDETAEEPAEETVEKTVEETVEAPAEESVEETEATEAATDETSDETSEETSEEAFDEDQERLILNLDELIDLDEASEIALAEAGSGEIEHWNLRADTTEWWDIFGDEENENPIWTIDLINVDGEESVEVHVDALTGEVLNDEDVQEETEEASDETAETAEGSVEESVEETVEETDAE